MTEGAKREWYLVQFFPGARIARLWLTENEAKDLVCEWYKREADKDAK